MQERPSQQASSIHPSKQAESVSPTLLSTLIVIDKAIRMGKSRAPQVAFINQPAPSYYYSSVFSSECRATSPQQGRKRQSKMRGDRLLLFSMGLVLLYFTSGSTVSLVEGQKTWCIAKPSASNEILAQNLDYACSQVGCAVIQKGGPCYYPDSLVSRAAVAMNLYYAYSGRHAWNCYFNNSALVVQSDPSYGSCTYY